MSAGNSDMNGTGKQDRNTCEISPAAQTDGSNGGTGVTIVGPLANQLGGGMLKNIPLGADSTHLGPGSVISNAEAGRAQPIALRHIAYQLAAANLNDTVYSRAYGRMTGVHMGDYEVSGGKIEWIRSENIFADFENLSGGSPPLGFMIKLYNAADVTGTTPTGSPFHTLEIRKLSASGSTLRMRVLEYGERNYVTEYRYTPNGTSGKTWEVLEGTHGGTLADGTAFTSLRRTLMVSTVNSGVSPVEYTEDHKIYSTITGINSGSEELVSHKTHTFRKYPIGDRLIKTVNDPSGLNLITELFYHESGTANGKIKQINYADGDWRRYEYHSTTVRRSKIVKPYLGTPAPLVSGSVPSSGVETIDYTNPSTGSRTITRSLDAQVVSKTWHTRSGSPSSGYTWTHTKASAPSAAEGASDNYKTQYVYFGTSASAPTTNRLKYIGLPGGIIRQFQYSNPSTGVLRIDTTEGPATGSYPFTFSTGTLTREEFAPSGQLILKTVWSLDSGMGGDPLQEIEAVTLDNRGRPTQWTDNLTGRNRLLSYACCGLAYERDFNGLLTVYTYDSLGNSIRVETGYPSSFSPTNVINAYISDYSMRVDALGRSRQITRKAHGGGTDYLLRTNNFNLAGELVSTVENAMSRTTYYRTERTTESSKKVVRKYISYPASGPSSHHRTNETTAFPEGRLWKSKSFASATTCASGTPSAVSGQENIRESLYLAYAVTASGGITFTITSLGDTVNTDRWTATTTDMLGRTVGTSRPSWNSATVVSTVSDYYASADSAAPGYFFGKLKWTEDEDSVRTFFRYNSEGELRDTILDLNSNNAIDDSSDRVTRTEQNYVLNGSSGFYAGALSKIVTKVLTSGTTELTVNEEWKSVTGDWQRGVNFNQWTSRVRSHSLSTPGSFTEEFASSDGAYNEDSYGNGRITVRWEDYGISGVTTVFSYDGFGRLSSVDDDSRKGVTTYNYYADDRHWKVTDPGSRVTEYTYDNLGQTTQIKFPDASTQSRTYFTVGGLKSVSGSQAYPVEYTYDSHGGRLTSMTTHYGPSSSPAITTWNYSGYRNLLTTKADSGDNMYFLGYTAAGRLKTRTWARGKRTRYDYDTAGQLNWKRYFTGSGSDTGSNVGNDPDTGDVHIKLDRNGRTTNLTTGYKTAFPGTSLSFGYAASNYWKPTAQGVTVDPDLVDADTPGATVSPSLVRTLWPSYYGDDRSSGYTLRDGTLASGAQLAKATWDYDTKGRISIVTGIGLAGSDRPFTYGWLEGAADLVDTVTGPAHTVDNAWEATRDILDTKSNIKNSGGTTISAFDYTVNSLGQRTAVAVTGSPAGGYTWGYNSAGELIAADHSSGTGYDLGFKYDSIGNRREVVAGTTTVTGTDNHTANNLNHYTSIGGKSPSYDVDGNMYADGGGNTSANARTYTWDGENRLIKVSQVSPAATLAEYLYDAYGRRVAKTAGGTRTYYIYDDWNMIAEFTGSVHTTGTPPALTHTRTHLWGLDLSGTFQGAGGVGGLLATDIKTGGTTGVFFPGYDGNGNIIDYINTSGTAIAHYEYNPFGHLHTSSLSASLFNFRFSTKFNDSETDFYYYGYRYYSTWMARWLNRDPVGEEGGVNLYSFITNNPINFFDVLGEQPGAQYPQGWWDDNARKRNTKPPVFDGDKEIQFIYVAVFVLTPVDETFIVCKAGRWMFESVKKLKWVKKFIKVPVSNAPKVPRARHHTDNQGVDGIERDGAINPARGDPPGVAVEVEPFGPTKPGLDGPKADTGAYREGGYVEFDLPETSVPTKGIGPRNTAKIPTNTPLPIRDLNPKFVRRPWWKFW